MIGGDAEKSNFFSAEFLELDGRFEMCGPSQPSKDRIIRPLFDFEPPKPLDGSCSWQQLELKNMPEVMLSDLCRYIDERCGVV